jgi:hypothetical protein
LTNPRVTCCGTTIGSLATTSENKCETWAFAKYCPHRALLGSEPVERVIGSIQRECLDHVIAYHEGSLRRIFRLLSPIENTSLIGERLTAATSDSAAGNGVRRGGAADRWTASPLRTTGCLKSQSLPGCALPLLRALKSVSGLCSLACPGLGGFHLPDSSRPANCLDFAVRLGEWHLE